jgi:hypothetical protein
MESALAEDLFCPSCKFEWKKWKKKKGMTVSIDGDDRFVVLPDHKEPGATEVPAAASLPVVPPPSAVVAPAPLAAVAPPPAPYVAPDAIPGQTAMAVVVPPVADPPPPLFVTEEHPIEPAPLPVQVVDFRVLVEYEVRGVALGVRTKEQAFDSIARLVR